MRYRRRPAAVDAVEWTPDRELGFFTRFSGHYVCRRAGSDRHGVEYTIGDVGLRTPQGFMRIRPGDWIVAGAGGDRWVCEADSFALLYEPAEA